MGRTFESKKHKPSLSFESARTVIATAYDRLEGEGLHDEPRMVLYMHSNRPAQWMAPDLHDKMQKSRHIVLSFDGARRVSGLGAAAWILWSRDEYGSFEKVSHGGRVLRNASAMTAEREALRLGIEYLTVLFPTEVSSFDFQVESTDRTVQYKLNAQSLRLFGLHGDVNDAHRAGANRLQNKQKQIIAFITSTYDMLKTSKRKSGISST